MNRRVVFLEAVAVAIIRLQNTLTSAAIDALQGRV